MKLLRRLRSQVKRPLFWLTFYLALLGGATTYGFWVDHEQDIARCRERNESIQKAVLIGAEAIIEVASRREGSDPEAIAEFRRVLEAKLKDVVIDCVE